MSVSIDLITAVPDVGHRNIGVPGEATNDRAPLGFRVEGLINARDFDRIIDNPPCGYAANVDRKRRAALQSQNAPERSASEVVLTTVIGPIG